MTQHEMNARRLGVSRVSRMAGLSLIELMVAVALGLLILTGLVTVFVNSSAARNEVERTSRQIENGRYAIEILSDDLRLAGFYGELNLFSAAPAIAVPTSLPDPCSTTVTEWAPALYLYIQGYNASNGALTCMPASYKTGTDVLVVRRVQSCTAAGAAACGAAVASKPYLQVSLCAVETPTTTHKLGLEGTETFNLKLRGATPTSCGATAPLRQYFVNIYFISTDNGAGQNVPTLKRLDFTGTGWTETPLVEGIEQINIDYGIDCDGDGLPDAYDPNPTAYAGGGSCTTAVNNWGNVMTARVYVLARNIEPSPGYTDTKTYQLGSASIAAPGDGYRRHVYTALVRINNPAGRRDTP